MDPVAALEAGLPVLLPTDTVYGLVSAPGEEPSRTLYELKGRARTQPTAILAATIDALLDAVPELDADLLRKLLPGPYTLVVANPAGRFPWLTGGEPGPIGVRVPLLPRGTHDIVETQRVVLATSANDPGGPNPVTLDDVPRRIRTAAARSSTSGRSRNPVDGDRPHSRRAADPPRGRGPATEALRRLRA